MAAVKKFIIVDDDAFNTILTSKAIKRILGEVDTIVFTKPEEGLAFIRDEYSKNLQPAVLFLDINMPTLTGWEFMEQYEGLSEGIKKQLTVYILSSSVDQRDVEKANANKYIKGFKSKPIDRATILSVAGK